MITVTIYSPRVPGSLDDSGIGVSFSFGSRANTGLLGGIFGLTCFGTSNGFLTLRMPLFFFQFSVLKPWIDRLPVMRTNKVRRPR
jgi:hypothetical protein